MSSKRPFTVKATLSESEKKTLSSLCEKAQMSEAELIRFFLLPDEPLTQDSDLPKAEKRDEMIYVRVSASEKKAIEKRADELGASVSGLIRRAVLAGSIEHIEFDRSSVDALARELQREGANLNQLVHFVNAQGLPAYNEKAIFRALDKVHDGATRADNLVEKIERRYFTKGGDAK